MRPWLVVAVLAAIAGVSGCGGSSGGEPPARRAVQRPAPAPARIGDRHFVGAPEVRVFHTYPHPEANVWVLVDARVDRGLPQGDRGVQAGFAVPGTATHSDPVPAMQHLPGVLGCYEQQNYVIDTASIPRDGQIVTVQLRVGGADPQTLTAHARVRATTSGVTGGAAHQAIVARLGCPAAPKEQSCPKDSPGNSDIYITAVAGGASCATGRRLMTHVGWWVSQGCWVDLCAHRHPSTLGFHCTVALVGEADWTITCTRGRQTVRASYAD